MKSPPAQPNKTLAILVLRSLQQSRHDTARIVSIRNSAISEAEDWIEQMPFPQAITLCSDDAIKQAVELELNVLNRDEEILPEELKARAAQVTSDYLLRHFRLNDFLFDGEGPDEPYPPDPPDPPTPSRPAG